MESIIKLPNDMFRQELLPYLTLHDIVKLDNACMIHEYRLQLLDKINGVILPVDKDNYMKVSLFKWLGMRRIYLIKWYFDFEDDCSFLTSIENKYVDQFRYTQNLVMKGCIVDDIGYSSYLTVPVCYRLIFQEQMMTTLHFKSQIIHYSR
jgi:hypothetical protein